MARIQINPVRNDQVLNYGGAYAPLDNSSGTMRLAAGLGNAAQNIAEITRTLSDANEAKLDSDARNAQFAAQEELSQEMQSTPYDKWEELASKKILKVREQIAKTARGDIGEARLSQFEDWSAKTRIGIRGDALKARIDAGRASMKTGIDNAISMMDEQGAFRTIDDGERSGHFSAAEAIELRASVPVRIQDNAAIQLLRTSPFELQARINAGEFKTLGEKRLFELSRAADTEVNKIQADQYAALSNRMADGETFDNDTIEQMRISGEISDGVAASMKTANNKFKSAQEVEAAKFNLGAYYGLYGRINSITANQTPALAVATRANYTKAIATSGLDGDLQKELTGMLDKRLDPNALENRWDVKQAMGQIADMAQAGMFDAPYEFTQTHWFGPDTVENKPSKGKKAPKKEDLTEEQINAQRLRTIQNRRDFEQHILKAVRENPNVDVQQLLRESAKLLAEAAVAADVMRLSGGTAGQKSNALPFNDYAVGRY